MRIGTILASVVLATVALCLQASAQSGCGLNGVCIGAAPSAGGGGTVSITGGLGITVTPSPITGTGSVALTTNTITIGGQVTALGGSTTNQGAGGKLQLSTGSTTTNDCTKFDAAGNTVDAGAACLTVLPSDIAYWDMNQSWTRAQRNPFQAVTISTATFTPNFDTQQNFSLQLVHASCPCTLANPSTTPVSGQTGVFVVIQSATGSDAIGTWGSDYIAAGSTSALVQSTTANALDAYSYVVYDATHIFVTPGVLNAVH